MTTLATRMRGEVPRDPAGVSVRSLPVSDRTPITDASAKNTKSDSGRKPMPIVLKPMVATPTKAMPSGSPIARDGAAARSAGQAGWPDEGAAVVAGGISAVIARR
jgi:hypothetical protein